MTIANMITTIEENNITEGLINALVEFMWDFDPYGILSEYGAIDDEGVREKVAEEVRYRLNEDANLMLNDLKYARDECGNCFNKNY